MLYCAKETYPHFKENICNDPDHWPFSLSSGIDSANQIIHMAFPTNQGQAITTCTLQGEGGLCELVSMVQ